MRVSGLKRFLLFTTPTQGGLKNYVMSYQTREEAIAMAESLKAKQAVRWQVIDNQTAEAVAEDPGI
ncbi:MAG: hypothetical protein SGJ21_14705 [Alphaproteobacteria bacterium]|nr:hypothetical protein [Alphaproteobacteria bacterium]